MGNRAALKTTRVRGSARSRPLPEAFGRDHACVAFARPRMDGSAVAPVGISSAYSVPTGRPEAGQVPQTPGPPRLSWPHVEGVRWCANASGWCANASGCDRPFRGGRSNDWVKLKNRNLTGDEPARGHVWMKEPSLLAARQYQKPGGADVVQMTQRPVLDFHVVGGRPSNWP